VNHADAFVADVVADPHDDAPRLIYADWLLDQDEPATRARAELIRVQYALERLAAGDVRRAALAQRQKDVLLAHEREWTAGLRELGVRAWRFRRGFVEGVKLHPASLVRNGERLRSLAPVRELDLTTSPDYPWVSPTVYNDWGAVAGHPLFAQLDMLDLAEVGEIGGPELRGLLAAAGLPRLERLAVTWNGAAGLAAAQAPPLRGLCLRNGVGSAEGLFSAPCLEGLTSLETYGCDDLTALGRSALPGTLEDLSLRGTIRDADDARRFARSPFPRLKRASLARVGPSLRPLLPAEGRRAEFLTRVESLDLTANGLDAEGVGTLAAGEWEGLRRLVLDGNPVGPQGSAALARSASLASLASLHLRTAGLGDDGLAALTALPGLRELNVSYNGIHSGGVLRLSERWPAGLEVLDLSWNPCRDAGVITLCQSAGLASLKALDLSYCELGHGAAEFIAHCPRLKNLETLNLATNRITDVGLVALAGSPHLGGLRSLHLGNSGVTDKGAEALFDSPLLSRLEVLMLNGTAVSESMRARLRKAYRGVLG
jgi:uncharacterized protein (TIGR02996 family)